MPETAETAPVTNYPDRSVWVHDIEIYPNYLLIGFKNKKTGKVKSWEVVGADNALSVEDAADIRKFMDTHRVVGFNSKSFDMVILYAALEGWKVKILKRITDEIIVGKAKSWDLEREYGFKIPRWIDHIDLIEVCPGKASLKIYNGRHHGKRMQDLPIEPDVVLDEQQIEDVFTYWKNDLSATELLLDKLSEQLILRTAMSDEFGIDLRSKSDAQVAEAVIKNGVEKLLGYPPEKPKVKSGKALQYNMPEYMSLAKHRALRAIIREIENSDFFVDGYTGKIIMPPALTGAEIVIGDGVYRLGIGGLHSSETCQKVVAAEDEVLVDRDVTSYYPFIIINQGLYPEHLGQAFLKVYKKIVYRRVKIKAEAGALQAEINDLTTRMENSNNPDGNELLKEKLEEMNARLKKLNTNSESLKITINGSFGKFGSMYSILYSPQLLIQTTISGQLSLLLLIDMLHQQGIKVVSANTDGIVIHHKKAQQDIVDAVVKEWEAETKFNTEATEYKAIYSRDVNNYIAVMKKAKKGSYAKTKGVYAEPGWQKNPTHTIVSEAVINFIVHGTPLSKTIRECRDLTKFLVVRQVKGGAISNVVSETVERWSEKTGKRLKDGSRWVEGDGGAKYLGKAIRWYYGKGQTNYLHYKSNMNTVPLSLGAKPCMDLPDDFPDDIDYGWYVKKARQTLDDIGYNSDLI